MTSLKNCEEQIKCSRTSRQSQSETRLSVSRMSGEEEKKRSIHGHVLTDAKSIGPGKAQANLARIAKRILRDPVAHGWQAARIYHNHLVLQHPDSCSTYLEPPQKPAADSALVSGRLGVHREACQPEAPGVFTGAPPQLLRLEGRE